MRTRLEYSYQPNPIVSIISVYTGMSTCLHTRVGTRSIVPSNDHIYSSFINVLNVYYTPMALILCSIYNNVCMYTTESTTNAFVPIPAIAGRCMHSNMVLPSY